MVMLNEGGKWIKTAEVNNGEMITIVDEGSWQESKFTYDDGNPKNDFVIKVEHKNEEKNMRLNQKNRTTLTEAYGNDTSKWVGKTAEITKKTVEVAGKDMEAIRLKISGTNQTAGQDGEVDQTEDLPF